ncbi:MAG: glycosyltransferase family 39 protein [Pseudomonadota bacterium]
MNMNLANAGALGLALLAAILLFFSTPWGLETSPDSLGYIDMARAIGGPEALAGLDTHWPPLYPLSLRLSEWTWGEILSGARFTHCLLHAINILAFYSICAGQSAPGRLSAVSTTCLFAFSPFTYFISQAMVSEVLFVTWILLALLALRRADTDQGGLAPVALMFACALLTRYSAVAFIGVACLWLLSDSSRPWFQRWSRSIVLGLASIAPLVVWLLVQSGNENAPRQLGWHPISLARALQLFDVLLVWAQANVIGTAAAACLLGVCIMASLTLTKSLQESEKRYAALLMATPLGYMLFLVLSISLFDFYTPIDARILHPGGVVLLAAMGFIASRQRHRIIAASAPPLIVFVLGVPALNEQIANNIDGGSGYFSRPFREQDLLPIIDSLDTDKIYSNAPEVFPLYFGHTAQKLPVMYSPINNQFHADYGIKMEAMERDVLAGRAVIVYFNTFAWREYYPDLEVLATQMALPVVFPGNSGVIFGLDTKRDQAD